jgi:hypothetical protein
MSDFKKYRAKKIIEIRPYMEGEDITRTRLSSEDWFNGSPKIGDMIARDVSKHSDQWLISKKAFDNDYELVT